MSIKIMDYVWEHSQQKGSNKLMLLAIADNANENGDAFPGMDRLAHKCGLSHSQAQNIIQHLEREGELQVYENVGTKTDSGWTNLYRIVLPEAKQPPVFDHDKNPVPPRPPKPLRQRKFPKPQEGQPVTPLAKTEEVEPVTPHEGQPVTPHEGQPVTPKPSVQPSDQPIHSPADGKKPIPLYDAVRDIWHYEGSLNGVMRGMLTGTAKQAGYAEHNLATPVTGDEILTWARWYRKTELKGNLTLNMVAEPMKVSSSITYWQSIGKPDPAAPRPKILTLDNEPAAPSSEDFRVFDDNGKYLGKGREGLAIKAQLQARQQAVP